jgi:hypothetical protein
MSTPSFGSGPAEAEGTEAEKQREDGPDNPDELDDETLERVSRETRSQPASDDPPAEQDQDIGKD